MGKIRQSTRVQARKMRESRRRAENARHERQKKNDEQHDGLYGWWKNENHL